METVKFALIGCGRISLNHIDGIKNAPHAQLVAVCDIAEHKAKTAALENDLSKWYIDAEEMLKNEEIDVVCVLVPSGLHCELTCLVARYKKHVLCEKPLDVTRDKMDKMISVCKRNGVLLGSIFQRRSFSAAIATKQAVAEGRLGKITLASASLKYYRNQTYYDSGEWRGTWELDGGGALMNQGIHGVDMISWIMGGIKSVYAKCENFVWNTEAEDTAAILVRFADDSLGVIECATSVYPGQDTIFSVQGHQGSIRFGDKGYYDWTMLNGSSAPAVTGSLGGVNCGYHSDNIGHIIQIEDMAMAVLENRPPMITGEEGKKAVEIILAIYESSKTGKEVFINN